MKILSVSIHEHDIVLYLFRFSIAFVKMFYNYLYKGLAHYIYDYIYSQVFDAILNNVILKFLLNGNLLLVCRSKIDFCTLIQFPVTLVNSFIKSDNLTEVSFEFSMHTIISSVNKMAVILLPFQFSTLLFPCLNALLRPYHTRQKW